MQESKQEYVVYTPGQLAWILWGRRPTVASTDPNAAMIARDGPAKPVNLFSVAVGDPIPFVSAKPPIAGLTRVSAQDHRVGGWGFVR